MNTTIFQATLATVFWVGTLFIIEYTRYRKAGSDALITNAFRQAVKGQPWVFILLALISGFMMGHCFGQ